MNILNTKYKILNTFIFFSLILLFLSPTPTHARDLDLTVDPTFTAEALPPEMKLWHSRLLSTFNKATTYPNPDTAAMSRNIYALGRTLNNHITALLAALRATGDPAILAEIDRLMELARVGLADTHPECTVHDRCTQQQDGFLNWVMLSDTSVSHYGNDVHDMDEMLTHSMVAAAAYAFYVNRDFSPIYQERSNFWVDYLRNHFEAKWRTRRNNFISPRFLDKNLIHPFIQFMRFDYYMHLMTNQESYQKDYDSRLRIAQEKLFIPRSLPAGTAYVWDHAVRWSINSQNELYQHNYPSYNCQTTSYAVYTFAAALDLGLAKAPFFAETQTLENFSRTMTDLITPQDSTGYLAPDVCGGITIAGEPFVSSQVEQDLFSRSIIWNNVGQGIFDTSGKLKALYEDLYKTAERNQTQPRQIFIPSYLLAILAHNETIPSLPTEYEKTILNNYSKRIPVSLTEGDFDNNGTINNVDFWKYLNNN